MDLNLEIQKKLSSEWFLYLQSLICYEFERIEKEVSKRKNMVSKKFKKKTWNKKDVNEGGEIMKKAEKILKESYLIKEKIMNLVEEKI